MSTAPFLSLHAVHAVPASLLNRDDSGRAKSIEFGGTRRVRSSSQSWKRAMRTWWRTHGVEGVDLGVRTTRLPAMVTAALVQTHGKDRDAAAHKAAMICSSMGFRTSDKTGNTSVSLFLPSTTAAALADLIAARWDDVTSDAKSKPNVPTDVITAAQATLDVIDTIDIAAGGRFLAEIPTATLDGALSVAHVFSVDPAAVELDFFTAVDDVAQPGEAVSSNLGVVDLAAPVMYRHAALDRRLLAANLAHSADPDALAATTQAAIIDAFLNAMPSAKHTSTAPETLPEVIVAVDAARSLSLANAYTDAITSDTVLTDAVERLITGAVNAARFLPGATVRVLPVAMPLDRLREVVPAEVLAGVTLVDSLTALTQDPA